MTPASTFRLRLFYSYSHRDQQHRARMEQALILLRAQDRVLKEWSDRQIGAGQSISREIEQHMESADIFAFLVSPHFIASRPCRQEWQRAAQIAAVRPLVVRVPIILAPCDWRHLDGMADIKALPHDGEPISAFLDPDEGWQQVCDGLRAVIGRVRRNFTIRAAFRREMDTTDFISQDHVPLQKIFVFPRLGSYAETRNDDAVQQIVGNLKQLLGTKHVLVHGDDLSGKTALCRHIFLSLNDTGKPVLYVNLATLDRRTTPTAFRDAYERQYHGDYSLWQQQAGKTLVIDNLSRAPHELDVLALAEEHFDRVIATTSSHTFYAYFRDDERLARFRVVEILPLTHSKQEQLIRRRMDLTDRPDVNVTDGRVDQIENQVNGVIIGNKILPRYPFYVLSILQTYEAFMPSSLSVTSHGHCYHVLIIAHLLKAGISRSDDEIDSCLNFCEHLAFDAHHAGGPEGGVGPESFERFLTKYKLNYVLKDSTLSRLCDSEYGIVLRDRGAFRSPYMYYFFLGRFLARRSDEHGSVIDEMLERSYVKANCLTLIFIVHHTTDDAVIEDIVLRNMCTLEGVAPATLERDEARVFEDIVAEIPRDVTSRDSVEEERKKARSRRDRSEVDEAEETDGREEAVGVVNDVYRILKNNEILGQVLRNKYGSLQRDTITEIVEAIADGGLRLVRLLVGSQEEMNRVATSVHKRRPELELERVKKAVRMLSFLWTMGNLEMVVEVLNKPEIRSIVEEVVERRGTAAYEVIGYFLRLDTADELTSEDHEKLKALRRRYRYPFLERVLSLRTQWYLNTHRVRVPVEQAICAELGVKYRPRLKTKG